MLKPGDYYAIQRDLLEMQRRVWEMFDELGRLDPDKIDCIRELREAVDKLGVDIGDARNKVVQMFEEACNEQ